jgi:hypothetical protein
MNNTTKTGGKEVRVFKTATGWNADMIGDEYIKRLFGTTMLPLPFTAQADAKTVMADVTKRNPDATVWLDD